MNIVKYYFPIVRFDEDNNIHHDSCDDTINDKMKNRCYNYLMRNMQYTYDAITYMSRRIDAEITTGIIISHTNKLRMEYEKLTITDATAGIGGDTFSFATFFEHVNAIEENVMTFRMLENNVSKCNYNNVTLINNNYLDVMENIKQDIVFIDPPWGGKCYKKYKSITLTLGEVAIEEICSRLLVSGNIVVLKLPLNYDFEKLYKISLCEDVSVFLHKLKRMYIVVLYNKNRA